MKPDAGDGSIRQKVLEYLQQHHIMTLATLSAAGPWATAVFYAPEGFDLYFVSSPRSRHAANLRDNPRAAAAIHGDYRHWRDIKGIQLEGRVEMVPVTGLPGAIAVYVARYPFVKDFLVSGSGLFRIGGREVRARFYRLRPERVLFLDNEAGFGHREEIYP